jgi:hypothetical protein
MIIKSLARKTASFAQLYDYLHRKGGKAFTVARNFQSFGIPGREEVIAEFLRNADHLPARRGGNYLYHEILSTKTVAGLPLPDQRRIMLDLAETYLAQRADRLLAYGCLHEERGHLHFHLMLSANELGQRRRFRLSKKRFADIQRDLEAQAIREYPELQERVIYGKEKGTNPTIKHGEYELRKRGSPTKKDQLAQTLKVIFDAATSQKTLDVALNKAAITLSGRGKAIVAQQGKLRCRLKTLHLHTDYEHCIAPWKRVQERQDELRALRDKQQTKQRDREHPAPYHEPDDL